MGYFMSFLMVGVKLYMMRASTDELL